MAHLKRFFFFFFELKIEILLIEYNKLHVKKSTPTGEKAAHFQTGTGYPVFTGGKYVDKHITNKTKTD